MSCFAMAQCMYTSSKVLLGYELVLNDLARNLKGPAISSSVNLEVKHHNTKTKKSLAPKSHVMSSFEKCKKQPFSV